MVAKGNGCCVYLSGPGEWSDEMENCVFNIYYFSLFIDHGYELSGFK